MTSVPSRDAPGRRWLQAGDHAQDRRLAGAAGAEQRQALARSAVERDALHDRETVEVTPTSSRVTLTACLRAGATLREEGHGGDDRHQDDAERHRGADVLGTGPAEEAEDRDRHGRPVRPCDEDGRAELAERDGEGEPRGDRQRPREERELDVASHLPGRRAEHGGRLTEGVDARSAGTSERTTNGSATSACATGTIAGDERRSSGGSSNASRKPKPSIAADAPSGSIRSASRPPRPRATATAAGIPTARAIAVAPVAKRSELAIACQGATKQAGVSSASEVKWSSP